MPLLLKIVAYFQGRHNLEIYGSISNRLGKFHGNNLRLFLHLNGQGIPPASNFLCLNFFDANLKMVRMLSNIKIELTYFFSLAGLMVRSVLPATHTAILYPFSNIFPAKLFGQRLHLKLKFITIGRQAIVYRVCILRSGN